MSVVFGMERAALRVDGSLDCSDYGPVVRMLDGFLTASG